MINGGYQASTTSFDDSFTFTLYQETGTTETSYPVDAGAIFEGGASVRLWKGLAVGGVISHFSVDSAATVTSVRAASVLPAAPPAGDRASRTGLRREETGVHIQAQYQLPPSDGCTSSWPAARASSTSSRRSSSTSITRKNSPTTPPTFTGVDSQRGDRNRDRVQCRRGFPVDVQPERSASAALVRITKATVDLSVDNRTIQVDAGGTQIAAGIRIAF